MKHHSAIEISLTTMHDLIEEARHHTRSALDNAIRQNTDAAVGSIVPAQGALEDALALQRAIIAIYRINQS